MSYPDDLSESIIFPKGQKIADEHFIGTAWIEMLVTDMEYNCPVYNISFEPGARNNWHMHPGGQILLVTGGSGYFQEEGKPARSLKPGDVVKIPPNVKHWHGAAKDSWFVHLGITANPLVGDAAWYEAVSEDEYEKIQAEEEYK